MTVNLTMQQRLNLEGLLGAQEGRIEELDTYWEIRRKIRVQNRDEYVREVLGRVMVDEAAMKLAPDTEVALEKAEAKALLKLFETWPRFTTNDLDWLLPLKAALKGEL